MNTNEIKCYEFEGKPLNFRKLNGDWWSDAREAAAALEYSSYRKVLNLFKRHEAEFTAAETCVLKVRTQGPKGVEQVREVRYFSPRGLAHLAILGRTAKCVRFHHFVLDVIESLRGGARLVTEEQMRGVVEQMAARFDAALDREHGKFMALAGLADVQASNAGRLLSFLAHTPDAKRALEEFRERKSGQSRLPFMEDDFGLPATGGF